MNYPYFGKQTIMQWILNTIDPRMWFKSGECECCWERFQGELTWIVLGGCPYHD